MSRLRTFHRRRVPRPCRRVLSAGTLRVPQRTAHGVVPATRWLLLLLALLAGCSSQPMLTSAKLPAGAAADQQKLFPSLEPNRDLVKFLVPSNDRDWTADQAVVAFADFQGDQVTVHNIRHITYRTAADFTVEHRDQTYDLGRLESVDFIVVPFNATPDMAHTMLSFGFDDGGSWASRSRSARSAARRSTR